MPKYIDVEKAREVISNYGKVALDDGRHELDPVDDIILLSGAVSVIPAADVAEVRRSRWIKNRNRRTCPECQFEYLESRNSFNYCPNCGTNMNKEGT